MNRLSRREVLGTVGLIAGAGMATTHALSSPASETPDEPADAAGAERAGSKGWEYVELKPAFIANKAYKMFPDGGCMYAVVGSILTTLGDMKGRPYRDFPLAMMRYGAGGTGGWGTLCGALNGAAALIGLFRHRETTTMHIQEVFSWYETAKLPNYRPSNDRGAPVMPSCIPGSVLCHVSLANWCDLSGHEVSSQEKTERCRRLTCDVVMKTVDVLNRDLQGIFTPAGPTPEVKSCISCHGKGEQKDAFGKMSCAACHSTLAPDHPKR